MFEHKSLPVCHLYDVPPSLAEHLCQVADLYYRYSSRGVTQSTDQHLRDICQKLHLQVPPTLQDRPSTYRQVVLQQVVSEVARKHTHTLFVVQIFNQLDAGCMCLIDQQRQEELASLIQRYALSTQDCQGSS